MFGLVYPEQNALAQAKRKSAARARPTAPLQGCTPPLRFRLHCRADVVANDSLCSLREAITNANDASQSGSVECAAGGVDGKTIAFAPSLAGGTIVLNGTPLQCPGFLNGVADLTAMMEFLSRYGNFQETKMRISFTMFGGFLVAALVLVFSSVHAHHGWSGNTAGEIELSGTVVSGVRLAGPHGSMQIEDADGQVWDITLAPGPRTHRAGLREGTIPVGAEVTVVGERHDDPEVFEAKVRRVIWEDQVFDVYPPQ